MSTPAHTPTPAHPPNRSSRRVALVLLIVSVLGLAAVLGVRIKQATAKRRAMEAQNGAEAQAQAASASAPGSVVIVHPTATRWKPRVEVTGTLKPWREADVGFETSGRLVKVTVSPGDEVKEGQTLALLDGTTAGEMVAVKEASVRAAQANLALAEDALRRTETLAASKSIADAQVEQARQQVALARAQLQAAQADARLAHAGQGQHAMFAPFAGVVTRAPTAGGGVVQPGTPLVHVEDLSRFRLSATVGEDDVPLVRVGEAARVTYRDRVVVAKVTALVPSLDQATRRAPVEIEVPNARGAASDAGEAQLLAWGFVRAVIDGDGEVDAVKIPGTARRPGSQDEVVKVDAGRARIVRVVHSDDADGSWIVRRGLSSSDRVVATPSGDLRDGDPIATP
jgi:RND family efflux transporter MFP subunit